MPNFVTTEKGFLLHLVAKTYPGTRPSDLYGRKSPELPEGLDDTQAFEFDSALAYRERMKERDQERRDLHEIVQAIRLTGRYHGHKKIKYEKYKSMLRDLVTTSDEADDKEELNRDDPLLIKLTKGSRIDHVTISRDNLQHP